MCGSGLDVALRSRRGIPLDARFTVGPGELLALVGPSGSGKTTVLRTIAGLHRPQDGVIRCDGETWLQTASRVDLRPQQRRVGLVFQDYALFPHLTAEENLTLAMDEGSRAQRLRRARDLLVRVRLDGLGGRLPRDLSGGQQQRVAVARALARDPRVLLLDEPFSAVDMMTRERLQRELAVLRQTIDIPVVLVTHDLQEAAALADRICVLHEGASLQAGTPEALFRRPASPRVARLLGRQNVFSGVVVAGGDPGTLQWGELTLEVTGPVPLASGTRVQWYIPDSDIVLHRRGRPSLGERENPVTGRVEEAVVMGAQTSVTLRCHHSGDSLRLSVSTHAARRNQLEPGAEASVSLLSKGIHLMPVPEGASGPLSGDA
ncbi:ABC transporter ATP-binding protein [Aquisalimonas asiatica]|uniref:Molybdate transport system ATP-binding protein n=1 Tax=Aquisalimonas asiatica TaxID=406100 RepID=A0A1H8RY39_9GAMM|nr:ABC transporter ATP-binding protein [Aquisalimonas asiatica]SEO70843.1 molybdate transport system ATP-binding protein [Aquisalimonas asiatica]